MATKKTEVKAETKAIATRAEHFDVLRKPVISEKAAKLAESNAIAFEIDPRATKKQVANAIKAIYNVAPEKINIVVTKGKVKGTRFHGGTGATRATKKAYVKLPKDAKIELATA